MLSAIFTTVNKNFDTLFTSLYDQAKNNKVYFYREEFSPREAKMKMAELFLLL